VPHDTVLVDIAATLISVEDNLDSQLVRLIMPKGADADQDAEFLPVQHAVLRECIVNLARVKEAIAAVVARHEPSGADQVPQLLRGITAGLLLLGRSRAVAIFEAISDRISELLVPNRPIPRGPLDRLADAIVSIEYYMETLQSGRSDPWYMLDNAEACLKALSEGAELAPLPEEIGEPAIAQTHAVTARVGETPVAAFEAQRTEVLPRLAEVAAPPAAAPDPELVTLFIEEAREEIAKINELFPRWDENPLDQDALVRVRRSFHTLKGSGRMVGARQIGEFGWAIETLLNRLINGTLSRTPGMLAMLREAVAMLPRLVDQLETGRAPPAEAGLLIGRAHAYAEGRDVEQALAARPEPVSSAPAAAAAAPLPAASPPEPLFPPPPSPDRPEAKSMIATDVLISGAVGAPAAKLVTPDGGGPPLEVPSRFVRIEEEAPRQGARDANIPPPPPSGSEFSMPPADLAAASTDAKAKSMIETDVLMSREAGAPAPPPPPAAPAAPAAPGAGGPVLEVPSRFVRADEEALRQGARDERIPPPPPSGSEFSMGPPDLAAASADPMLVDIYRGEVSSHIAAVRQFLDACAGRFAPFTVTEALHRACHTLAGASKMAEARQGIKLAEPLNLYIRKLHDHGLGLPEAGRRVLADIVAEMEHVAQHFDEASQFFTTHADLLARLKWLDADADREIAARVQPAAAEGQDSSAAPAPGSDLLAADEMLVRHAAEPPSVAGPAPRRAAEAHTADDFDAEIAVIFSEEATELLEVAERAFAAFRADARDTSRVTELKRVLHTLKGGARMAGVTAMGDLAHELETLLTHSEAGDAAGDRRTVEVMQASLDELSRMRETVSTGRQVVPARDLVTRIRALARGIIGPPVLKSGAVEQPLPSPATPPVEAAASTPPPVVRDIAATGRVQALVIPPAVETPPPAATPEVPAVSAVEAAAVPAAAPAGLTAQPPVPEVPAAGAVEPPLVPEIPAASAPPAAPPTEEPAGAMAGDVSLSMTSESLALQHAFEESRSIVLPPGREPSAAQDRPELARVDAELLDSLLNSAGEVSIYRARLEQQFSSVEFNLAELSRVVQRLKEQLRNLELETEAQILHRHDDDGRRRDDFDPLELDRYSSLQQFSRALAESTSDVASVQSLLESQTREAQNLLMQQARVVTDLQNGLMRTRMVPFQRHVARLTRIVRQVAAETGRKVDLVVTGAAGELDRQVLERMLPPLEHMLRNAVVHGIEAPAERVALGKPEAGRIEVSLRREGAEVVIAVNDDGRGMNLRAIRDKALALGHIQPRQTLSDQEAMQLILEPGFSTASTVTQAAGRGVGMDVASTEIKRLGGALQMDTTPGQGTRFTIRLPFTLAISQALIVRTDDELYALPLPSVEGVVRLPRSDVQRYLADDAPGFEYGGQRYRFQHLSSFIGGRPAQLPENDAPVPVVLIRAGDSSTALVTDELVGSREIVVKNVGPQVSGIRGIAGATMLGDGRIVIILDMGSLVRGDWRARPVADTERERADRRIFALVVDDSITVRRVTQRLLERNGMRVMTAKDGIDALSILQDHVPDVILLDIEMPRMDGYEVAAQVRADERLKNVPIVMITSRVGEKHRARAIELGVNEYLGKPYQENQLLDAIEPLVNRRQEAV